MVLTATGAIVGTGGITGQPLQPPASPPRARKPIANAAGRPTATHIRQKEAAPLRNAVFQARTLAGRLVPLDSSSRLVLQRAGRVVPFVATSDSEEVYAGTQLAG